MYFLQISDTHHLNDYETNPDLFHDAFLNLKNHVDVLTSMSQELEQCNQPLSFVCHCGDLSHHGEKEDYEKVAETLKNVFDVPLIVTAGNHDKRDFVQEVFYHQVQELFCHDTTLDGLRILSFDNSNERYKSGEITEKTCVYLLEKLKEQPEQPTILMCHHHCIPEQSPMPTAEIHPLFREVLAQKQVKALLTGHSHQQYVGELFGVPYFTVGSHSFTAEELGEGKLNVYQSICYHLFSYENGALNLVSEKNLPQEKQIGKAQKLQT